MSPNRKRAPRPVATDRKATSQAFRDCQSRYAAWLALDPDEFAADSTAALDAYYNALDDLIAMAPSQQKVSELLRLAMVSGGRQIEGTWNVASAGTEILALFAAVSELEENV